MSDNSKSVFISTPKARTGRWAEQMYIALGQIINARLERQIIVYDENGNESERVIADAETTVSIDIE